MEVLRVRWLFYDLVLGGFRICWCAGESNLPPLRDSPLVLLFFSMGGFTAGGVRKVYSISRKDC